MEKKKLNILVVGSGLSGCVCSRLLAQEGHNITLIEKKNKIGGLCRDEYVSGVLTHIHGPHYFHTNNRKTFTWLSKFCEDGWIEKDYIVKSNIDGDLYGFPINRLTINEFFDINLKTKRDVEKFLTILTEKWKDIEPKNSEEIILKRCGRLLYENFFKNYTIKMWDLHPDEICSSICGRVPIRANDEKVYHLDKYQGVPKKGYTEMFNKMIDHKNITIELSKDYSETDYNDYDLTIYTGPIDYFFSYEFGQLPYRSLKFNVYVYPFNFKQECAQINYPGKEPYTRDTETKHITGQECDNTTVVRETPCYDIENQMYPVINNDSIEKLKKYQYLADKIKDKVRFIGRLANFEYENMAPIIEKCFELIKQLKKEEII